MKTNHPLARFLFSAVIAVVLLFLTGMAALAENIDPNNDGSRYAYGENVGWFNAEPSGNGGPGVEVESLKLTGYLWAEDIGWVSLSCENTSSCAAVDYGVAQNGKGQLTGYAWAENVGWVSFSCLNTGTCGRVNYGVYINPNTGQFSGKAWGENIGWVSFASTGSVRFSMVTAWRALLAMPWLELLLDN